MTMVLDSDDVVAAPRKKFHATKLRAAARAIGRTSEKLGLGLFAPFFMIAAGEAAGPELGKLWERMVVPFAALVLFLAAWAWAAPKVETSLGAVPGPAQAWEQARTLWADHEAERQRATEFYERQAERNAQILAQDPTAEVRVRAYTGRPTYLDQIATSLKTVFAGFLIASIVAVPLGVACGLSRTVQAALNPIIQILRPVSPLAWLPIVTMVVSALYVSESPIVAKSFVNSAITVTLCSLWPTLINTALGVASIDKDLLNVARVLRLSTWTKIVRVVLPSALPYIFAGLRLSLGVGWMVLIAAEMLAQNPGLGKFVWDEFQNGSSNSLARIMVAVLTIGLIGFVLDRIMYALQAAVSPQTGR